MKVIKNKKNSLGSEKTTYQYAYDSSLLASVPNKHASVDAWASFLCTEFTSLCPKTGQPDFARITINYIPGQNLLESKSLKLYLFSFRNHGDFHEDCIHKICQDIVSIIGPKFIEVIGEFTPRGGITIYPYASYAIDKQKYKNIYNQRFMGYTPGKYSMDFSRIY